MPDESFRIRLRRRLGLPIVAPSGWNEGPPDFVGVGTQRSGTTWWFRQLLGHPDIVAPWGKERHYFDPFWGRGFSAEDRLGYQRLFPRPPGTITGEWTPRYMYDPWVPPLLREAAPETRVLILLRDPWLRYVSGVAHVERVLARDLRRGNQDYLRLMIRHDALERSLYAAQVRHLLESFDRSQVLVLQYERCVREPEEELERTFRFLGLELPAAIEVERRAGVPAPVPAKSTPFEEEVRRRLAADVEELMRSQPAIDPALWPTCA